MAHQSLVKMPIILEVDITQPNTSNTQMDGLIMTHRNFENILSKLYQQGSYIRMDVK